MGVQSQEEKALSPDQPDSPKAAVVKARNLAEKVNTPQLLPPRTVSTRRSTRLSLSHQTLTALCAAVSPSSETSRARHCTG